MQDVAKKTLKVGQTVAMIVPYYHELKLGIIVKVTPKGATIQYQHFHGDIRRVSRTSGQFAVIEDDENPICPDCKWHIAREGCKCPTP